MLLYRCCRGCLHRNVSCWLNSGRLGLGHWGESRLGICRHHWLLRQLRGGGHGRDRHSLSHLNLRCLNRRAKLGCLGHGRHRLCHLSDLWLGLGLGLGQRRAHGLLWRHCKHFLLAWSGSIVGQRLVLRQRGTLLGAHLSHHACLLDRLELGLVGGLVDEGPLLLQGLLWVELCGHYTEILTIFTDDCLFHSI